MTIDLTEKEAEEVLTGLIFLASPDIIHSDYDTDANNTKRLKLIKKISKTFNSPPKLKSLSFYSDMIEFENKELLDKIRKHVIIDAEIVENDNDTNE